MTPLPTLAGTTVADTFPHEEDLGAHLEEAILALLEGDTPVHPEEVILDPLAAGIPALLEEGIREHRAEDDDPLHQDLPAEATEHLVCQEEALRVPLALQDGRAARTDGTRTSTYP